MLETKLEKQEGPQPKSSVKGRHLGDSASAQPESRSQTDAAVAGLCMAGNEEAPNPSSNAGVKAIEAEAAPETEQKRSQPSSETEALPESRKV